MEEGRQPSDRSGIFAPTSLLTPVLCIKAALLFFRTVQPEREEHVSGHEEGLLGLLQRLPGQTQRSQRRRSLRQVYSRGRTNSHLHTITPAAPQRSGARCAKKTHRFAFFVCQSSALCRSVYKKKAKVRADYRSFLIWPLTQRDAPLNARFSHVKALLQSRNKQRARLSLSSAT